MSSDDNYTIPQQSSSIRVNGFAMLQKQPCKIVEMSTSKTGKHGGAKIHFIGIEIFSGRKVEEIANSTHNIDVPIVTKADFQVLNLDSDAGYVSVLDPKTLQPKDDIPFPSGELGEKLDTAFLAGKEITVTVIGAVGKEAIIGVRQE